MTLTTYTKFSSKTSVKCSEVYLGPCQTSMMELFTKIVNGFISYRNHYLICKVIQMTGFYMK